MSTPKIGLPELIAAQSSPEVTVNQSLRILDQMMSLSVLDITNTPAVSPADGDAYIVGTSPTGAWTGHAKSIAFWVAGTFNQWRFVVPFEGLLAYVKSGPKYYYFSSGSTWTVTSII